MRAGMRDEGRRGKGSHRGGEDNDDGADDDHETESGHNHGSKVIAKRRRTLEPSAVASSPMTANSDCR
jgi:hypothetical protein